MVQVPLSATFTPEQQNNQDNTGWIYYLHQHADSAGTRYDFSHVKLAGAYRQIGNTPKAGGNYTNRTLMLGAAGTVKTPYDRHQNETFGSAHKSKANQLSLDYEYNLSKRTAIYGTTFHLKNKDKAMMSLAPTATISPSGKQQAY